MPGEVGLSIQIHPKGGLKNPTPEAKRTIAQALEQIYSNVEWLKKDKEGIKKLLENHM